MEKEKPDLRERVFARGLDYPSDEELLMLILGSGMKNVPVEALAYKIKSVVDIADRDNLIGSLLKIPGVGLGKALSVAAAVEFGRRRAEFINARIKRPTDLLPFIRHYGFKSCEHFITVSLSGSHEILSQKVIAVGSSNSAIISPRDVLFEAAKSHAAAIIIAHNHPTGPCAPSNEDLDTTVHIQKAADILGIALLDHIILNKTNYFSFKEAGLLDFNKIALG